VKILRVAAISLLFLCCRDAPEPATQTAATTTSTPPAERPAPAPEPCIAEAHRLCPADEGNRDPTFVAFRERLSDALAEKNEARLLELVDPNIRTSFGDGGGIAAFREQWKTAGSESELWPVLGKIINLGGTFRGSGNETSFWAPYVYSSWPETVDAFEHVAAIRAGVPVRERPGEDSNAVTRVDWAILRVVPSGEAPKSREWLHVRAPGGAEGWVHAGDVHSPVGYRAGFSKRTGEWKLEALVAGD
jgi:hypothetical protein